MAEKVIAWGIIIGTALGILVSLIENTVKVVGAL